MAMVKETPRSQPGCFCDQNSFGDCSQLLSMATDRAVQKDGGSSSNSSSSSPATDEHYNS
jgi:hypothetical protein